MRTPLLLAVLAACSADTQRSIGLDRGTALLTVGSLASEPVLVRNAGSRVARARTDTLVWSDSAVRGDTTFHHIGRAITTTAVLTDSQWISITPTVWLGIPFGLFSLWSGTKLRPNTDVMTMTYGGETPATLVTRLAAARARGLRMVILMTGGARANYLTNGVFDPAKWKARMNSFNTAEIRAAVAQAVSDGVLIGNTVMDEPFNDGGPGNEGNSWGPKGTMNKARVDSLCGYSRQLFPTLPAGVFHDWSHEPGTTYQVCDFMVSQYRIAKGNLPAYRDSALAVANRGQHAIAFSINVLDGGVRAANDGSWNCSPATTGGRGTYAPNCRMTAEQVRETGRMLGSAGCFLTGFRYDSAFMAKAENQAALRDVAATLAARPATSCVRR